MPINNNLPVSAVLQKTIQQIRTIKQNVNAVITESAAGPIKAIDVLHLSDYLARKKFDLQSVMSPELDAYARLYFDDPAFNASVEIQNIITNIDSTIQWIIANFPNTNGNLHVVKILGDGQKAPVTWSSAQTAPMRTVLQSLTDAI